MDEETIQILKLFFALQVNLISVCLAWHLDSSKRWLNRRWHVRPIFRQRSNLGHFETVFQELKKDSSLFFSYTRMNLNTFNYLNEILCIYLTKKRSNITAEQRLILTLRYLATGYNIYSIAVAYRIAPSTCYVIIKETCSVIFEKLSPFYLKVPSRDEWLNISDGFWKEWNFPHCCGAMDGKHVLIKAPPNSHGLYFNYKKTYSIVLLAVCDHEYKFTLFDVGALGSESDGGIFARSEMGKALRRKELNFPEECSNLPESSVRIPYYFVGDEAFELTPQMMRPYPGRNLDDKKRIFNYRLSRARRIIENSFGILTARWQFLSKAVGLRPDFVTKCVLASICLHNILMDLNTTTRNLYCPSRYIDEDINNEYENGQWRQDFPASFESLQNINLQNEVLNAHAIRDKLANYFLTREGEVPWQYEYLQRGTYEDRP